MSPKPTWSPAKLEGGPLDGQTKRVAPEAPDLLLFDLGRAVYLHKGRKCLHQTPGKPPAEALIFEYQDQET